MPQCNGEMIMVYGPGELVMFQCNTCSNIKMAYWAIKLNHKKQEDEIQANQSINQLKTIKWLLWW